MTAKELAKEIVEDVLSNLLLIGSKEVAIQSAAAKLEPLVCASALALTHVTELRKAWRTGAIDERDGYGGLRSNRNVDVEVALRKALEGKRGDQ